ncbi:MAG: NAD(P)/FAD-dependent oxidoreductase [Sinobacteraceae bacterium]|nr:NAD(P)/FAD-dependent oxidoreductase [Nevskiaceae bacterium]
MSSERMHYHCIVIGAGHNGLVCAAYLARSGRSVLVLEAGSQVGGAAVTREFAPGFKVSACAHLLQPMSSAMIEDLRLEHHGLRVAASQLPTTALQPEGPPLHLGPSDLTASGCSMRDVAAYPHYAGLLDRFAAALQPLLLSVPPRLGSGRWADRQAWLRLGWQLRRLGRADLRELLRIAGMNVYDLMQEHFETPLLQAALAFDALLGTNFGPRSPGSVFTLLYRLATGYRATSARGARGLMQPEGGLGRVAAALAQAATAAGAEIRTGTPVQQILVENHQVSGVRLASGETLTAETVISNADPQTTFLRLLGAEHLDAGFTRRIANLRTRGLCAKLHLALDELPPFTGTTLRELGGRLLLAPSLDYLERAFNHSKYREYSMLPALEITVPTVNDAGLAPAGRHVLSALVQYAPYDLAGGWDAARHSFLQVLLGLLEQHAPGISRMVRAAELLTPADVEREFRISGGHWHHAELALDQFFILRPVPGATQYGAPVDGLYLCGAGCHPGGGIMGTAGRNAARQILENAA